DAKRRNQTNGNQLSNAWGDIFKGHWKGAHLMNIQRITAIFEKDLKDFMKNSMLVFLPFLPIFMAFIFSKTGENLEETLPAFLVYVVIGVAFAGVTCNCIMFSMAEEKEKNTLRGLMLSPASF